MKGKAKDVRKGQSGRPINHLVKGLSEPAFISPLPELISTLVFAALDRLHGGERGVHPCSCSAGAQRQPGDDAGLETFHSGKVVVCFLRMA